MQDQSIIGGASSQYPISALNPIASAEAGAEITSAAPALVTDMPKTEHVAEETPAVVVEQAVETPAPVQVEPSATETPAEIPTPVEPEQPTLTSTELDAVVPDAATQLEPGVNLQDAIGDAATVTAVPKERPAKKKKKGKSGEASAQPTAPKEQPKPKDAKKHKPAVTIAEGSARIVVGRNDEVRFRGIHLEGRDKSGRPRNRILVLGTAAPKWFRDYCNANKESGTTRVRIRVIGLIGEGLAVAVPAARSQEEFEADQGREFMQRANTIRSFDQAKTDEQVTEFVYRTACELAKLDFGGVQKYEDGGVYGVGIDNRDNIFHLTGIENFLDFAEGIRRGATTVEKEIEYNIRYNGI